MNWNKEDREKIVQSAENLSSCMEDLLSLSEDMGRNAARLKDELAFFLSINQEADLLLDPQDLMQEEEKLLYKMRVIVRKMEEDLLTGVETIGENCKARYLHGAAGIKIRSVTEEEVILSLPMLPKRIRPIKTGIGKGEMTTDSSGNYQKEIEYLLLNDERITNVLSSWREKSISFFFAYSLSDTKLIDTDSHDTKSVIDALCRLFPSGDSPLTTSIRYQSIRNEKWMGKTIVTLDKGLENYPALEVILERIKSEIP